MLGALSFGKRVTFAVFYVAGKISKACLCVQ